VRFVLLILLLATAPVHAKVGVDSYRVAGHRIDVDWIRPDSPGPHPTVVLLHGSGGVMGNLAWMQAYGEYLARRGYAVVAPHFFMRTGTIATGDILEMTASFPAWLEAVDGGIAFAASRSWVDRGRIAVAGFSLGGYLALAQATPSVVPVGTRGCFSRLKRATAAAPTFM